MDFNLNLFFLALIAIAGLTGSAAAAEGPNYVVQIIHLLVSIVICVLIIVILMILLIVIQMVLLYFYRISVLLVTSKIKIKPLVMGKI